MSKYIYKYTKARKINATTRQMHTVTVFTLKDKQIGQHSWSYLERDSEAQIQRYVTMLIREYELSKIWNRPLTR